MAAAIEANWNAAFSLVGRSPIAQSDDDDPELRWYTTPKIPLLNLQPRLFHEALAGGHRRQDRGTQATLRGTPGAPDVSVGPFSRPPDLGALERVMSYGRKPHRN